jgi:hypothetical protein
MVAPFEWVSHPHVYLQYRVSPGRARCEAER